MLAPRPGPKILPASENNVGLARVNVIPPHRLAPVTGHSRREKKEFLKAKNFP